MKLHYFIYECANCENRFKSPHLTGGGYGDFLMRSEKGDIAYLYAINNDPFQEFSNILEQHSSIQGMKDAQQAKILHKIFGYACDISLDETRYQITQKPICPACGKCEIKHWGPTNPPEFVEMNVKSVTHEAWNKLQWKEKQDVVNEALNNYFKQEKIGAENKQI